MNNFSTAQSASVATQKSSTITRGEWTKPSAKAAEVAQATLTGFAVPPTVDFSTCAS